MQLSSNGVTPKLINSIVIYLGEVEMTDSMGASVLGDLRSHPTAAQRR
jgi:anti-anti-sigma regulatory factor